MVVLDTDILVAFLRNDNEAVNFIGSLQKKNMKISTTTISAFELFEGALISSREENIEKAELLLKSMGSYNFNGPASWKAAEISSELLKKGEPLDFQDIAIAAIAIINGESLTTRNVKHFSRIKGLKVEKW
jgi:predicted nucleic acid-binding protein